jgi:uncharacterized protein
MSLQTAFQSIDFIANNYPVNTGIIFFGGEPLLKKDLIKQTIEYSKTKSNYFHYKVTTNGILLDEEFLKYANKAGLQISVSIDGNEKAHNTFRKFPDGKTTFKILDEKTDLLLHYQPYAKVLMTVSPETLIHYADSVEFLLQKGFKYIVVSLDFSSGNWNDSYLKELKRQYERISKIYETHTLDEKKFYFSPFEMKLASHIRQNNFECYQCHLAKKQISIAFDGLIYPCVQFVKDGVSNKEYAIGSVAEGINSNLQNQLYQASKTQPQVCLDCDYNPRCNNKCSCLSWQLTGKLNQVSPVVCESERILIPVVDKLGEKLFGRKSSMFIQKHYNAAYPILSMLEDLHI